MTAGQRAGDEPSHDCLARPILHEQPQQHAPSRVNDVRYPPPAFIDQAAQTGFRMRTAVIQKLLVVPEQPRQGEEQEQDADGPQREHRQLQGQRANAEADESPAPPTAASTDERA